MCVYVCVCAYVCELLCVCMCVVCVCVCVYVYELLCHIVTCVSHIKGSRCGGTVGGGDDGGYQGNDLICVLHCIVVETIREMI